MAGGTSRSRAIFCLFFTLLVGQILCSSISPSTASGSSPVPKPATTSSYSSIKDSLENQSTPKDPVDEDNDVFDDQGNKESIESLDTQITDNSEEKKHENITIQDQKTPPVDNSDLTEKDALEISAKADPTIAVLEKEKIEQSNENILTTEEKNTIPDESLYIEQENNSHAALETSNDTDNLLENKEEMEEQFVEKKEQEDNAVEGKEEANIEDKVEANQVRVESDAQTDNGALKRNEKDKYNAKMQWIITKKMKDTLMNELGYKEEEIDDMMPDVAATVINKRLTRPKLGMPEEWRKSFDRSRTEARVNKLLKRMGVHKKQLKNYCSALQGNKKLMTGVIVSGLGSIIATGGIILTRYFGDHEWYDEYDDDDEYYDEDEYYDDEDDDYERGKVKTFFDRLNMKLPKPSIAPKKVQSNDFSREKSNKSSWFKR